MAVLGLGFGGHWNLMVGMHQVDFGKDSAAVQVSSKIVQVGNRVTVWDCDVVQCPVVTTWSPVTQSFLGHHVEG